MRNYPKVLLEVKKLVKNKLGKESSGHDYWHCYRVVQNALVIGKEEKANLKVLELSAALHDISIDKSKKDHEIRGAQFTQKFLSELGLNKKAINQIVNCIKKHRFSKGIKAVTLEEKILQDADKLDALGAIGIARLFALSGKYKQIIYDPKIKPDFN